MANFDTQAKRFSGIGIDMPWPMMLPKPTGTIDGAERQAFLRKYSGILWGAVTTAIRDIIQIGIIPFPRA